MGRPKEKQRMKNITIALPEVYVQNILKLQNIGLVPSRSEAIRNAVKEFLQPAAFLNFLLFLLINMSLKVLPSEPFDATNLISVMVNDVFTDGFNSLR